MDDTSADFIGDERLHSVPLVPEYRYYPEIQLPNFFLDMKPMQGAIEGIKELIAHPKLDIYICSVPIEKIHHSYSEKSAWIEKHLPELSGKLILTQNKNLVHGDYLIDDSLTWMKSWPNENRKFIHFDPRKDRKIQWEAIVKYFYEKY